VSVLGGEAPTPSAGPAVALPTPASQPPALQQPKQWAKTALERPLLIPGRRLPPPEAETVAAAAMPPRLSGTVIGAGVRHAMFAGLGGDRHMVVPEGGRSGPWLIQAVTPGRATLSGPGGLHHLRVGREPSAGPPAQPDMPGAAKLLEPAVSGIWHNPCGRSHGGPPTASRPADCAILSASAKVRLARNER
jgi:hypothetical protein